MVNHLNAKAEQDKTPNVRKLIVLITDGEDRKSKIKEKELLAELQQHQIKVFAIGLVQELDNEAGLMRPSAKRRAVKFLSNITKETGGRALFPKSNSGAVDALLFELFAPPK
nr:J321 [uncultured bacterium]